MTKITDESSGHVYEDGRISKPITKNDLNKIEEGTKIARNILTKAGADCNSFINSLPAGSHPGGTAAIGKVVDKYMQSKIDNLFVCDASVLPKSPGLPPMLTLIALSKRLSKILV